MKRYNIVKYDFDLTDKEHRLYLQEKYKKYYTQQIEGHSCCISYFDDNLIFVKRVGKRMLIVSVFAPSKNIRDFWCTFPLRKLSRRIFDLFYKRKYILL